MSRYEHEILLHVDQRGPWVATILTWSALGFLCAFMVGMFALVLIQENRILELAEKCEASK